MCAVLVAILPVTCISELAVGYFTLPKYYPGSLLFQISIYMTTIEQLQVFSDLPKAMHFFKQTRFHLQKAYISS